MTENPTVKKFSKTIYNRGLTPIVLKRTAKELIVLQPRKQLVYENKVADEYIAKFENVVDKNKKIVSKEVKDKK